MQGDPFGLLLQQRIIFMGGEVGLPARLLGKWPSNGHIIGILACPFMGRQLVSGMTTQCAGSHDSISTVRDDNTVCRDS